MAERRVAERAAALELARVEPRDVVARGVRDRARIGLERLHDDAPRRVAAAASRELGDELEGSLLGAKVRQTEPRVRVDDGGELDAGEVVALRNHLRADEHGAIGAGEPFERVAEVLGVLDGVGVEPDALQLGDALLELTVELLGTGADTGE